MEFREEIKFAAAHAVGRRSASLTELLHRPTLDDIIVVMAAMNLVDGKVWMNYQGLKEFLERLEANPTWHFTQAVQHVIGRVVLTCDIDHSMTRIMGLSGLVSYVAEVGNDYWYMTADQQGKVMDRFGRMAPKDQASLSEIARRYGEQLKARGR